MIDTSRARFRSQMVQGCLSTLVSNQIVNNFSQNHYIILEMSSYSSKKVDKCILHKAKKLLHAILYSDVVDKCQLYLMHN